MALLIAELTRLATQASVPILAGEVTKDAGGGWRFATIAGTFADEAASGAVPYWDHLDRRTASVAASKTKGAPNPSLALMLPAASATSLLTNVLSDADLSAGVWRIEILPMIAAHFTRLLHVLPEGMLSFTVRLQRRASGENAPDHRAMLAATLTLVQRYLAVAGKMYPPFAPPLSQDGWQQHYGPGTWKRFADAKRRFDPKNVLTPGVGVFVARGL